MRTTITSTWLFVLLWAIFVSTAQAQKGMGERTGVGRRSIKPDIVALTGSVSATKIGPCEKTTGRAEVGAHVLLATPEGEELNIHLGPAVAVDHIVELLTAKTEIAVQAFRTKRMPQGHYVAQTVIIAGTTFRLRDEGLRPVWAFGSTAPAGNRGPHYRRGGMRRGSPWPNRAGYGFGWRRFGKPRGRGR